MQLKTRQIVITLNLDCFRPVGLYCNPVHVVWIALLTLTDNQLFSHLWCTKRFGEVYAAFNGEVHADYFRLVRLAAGLVYTQAMILQ